MLMDDLQLVGFEIDSPQTDNLKDEPSSYCSAICSCKHCSNQMVLFEFVLAHNFNNPKKYTPVEFAEINLKEQLHLINNRARCPHCDALNTIEASDFTKFDYRYNFTIESEGKYLPPQAYKVPDDGILYMYFSFIIPDDLKAKVYEMNASDNLSRQIVRQYGLRYSGIFKPVPEKEAKEATPIDENDITGPEPDITASTTDE